MAGMASWVKDEEPAAWERRQARDRRWLVGLKEGASIPLGVVRLQLPLTDLGWLSLLVALGLEFKVPVSLQPQHHRPSTQSPFSLGRPIV